MVLVVQEAFFLTLIKKNNNQVSPLGSDLTFSRLVVVPLPKEEVVVGGCVVVSGGCAGGCAQELGRGPPQRYSAHVFG